MNEQPQPACKNRHTTHKGCTWRTHKHGDKHTTYRDTHTIWQRGSRKSNKSRLQKSSLRTPKRRAAESLGMRREGFVPFFYTASNSFKEFVWVCVKDWGGRRTYHTHGVWLHVGSCQTDMGLGRRFHSQNLFPQPGSFGKFWLQTFKPLRNSRVISSQRSSFVLIWYVQGHYIQYVKYYKY